MDLFHHGATALFCGGTRHSDWIRAYPMYPEPRRGLKKRAGMDREVRNDFPLLCPCSGVNAQSLFLLGNFLVSYYLPTKTGIGLLVIKCLVNLAHFQFLSAGLWCML